MHMADALLSPAVGGTFWAATGGMGLYCSRNIRKAADDSRVPLMGVLGAFVFAAQMINFTIPGTGSSGHIGGGMLLAILLGPQAAFLVISSVLLVQALFFADGGLLAYGCNLFNMGFFPCFIAYPLIYRTITAGKPTRARITTGAVAGSVIALLLGAGAVVLQTALSGISEIPFTTFLLLMLPIHLAIGIVEGIVTAGIVLFIRNAAPDILNMNEQQDTGRRSLATILEVLALAAVLTGGVLSWFASVHPDGLEWSIFHATGTEELEAPNKGVHSTLAGVQGCIALLPDYGFRDAGEAGEEAWPALDPGTSVSGLVGGTLTLLLTLIIAAGLKLRRSYINAPSD